LNDSFYDQGDAGVSANTSAEEDATWMPWIRESGLPPFSSVLRVPSRDDIAKAVSSTLEGLQPISRAQLILRWMPSRAMSIPRFVIQGWWLLSKCLLVGERPLFVAHGVIESSHGRPGVVFVTSYALRFLPYAGLDEDILDPSARLPITSTMPSSLSMRTSKRDQRDSLASSYYGSFASQPPSRAEASGSTDARTAA